MKKRGLLCLVAALALLAAGCAPSGGPGGAGGDGQEGLSVVTTTYPAYLFVSALADGVDGLRVERLNTGQTSCLHDYTLTVGDMKRIEGADLIVLNGAGLEDFMDDALAASDAAVVDCSAGLDLLEAPAHDHAAGDEDDHDHGHWDPHYWMSPLRAARMVDPIREGLCRLDPAHEQAYTDNAAALVGRLEDLDGELRAAFTALEGTGGEIRGLITFHDGFQYFAHDYGLPLLAAIEEEEGSEASAKEIAAITALVKDNGIPVIFTEVNGSDATARAISRESGCAVEQLTMVMDGPDDSLSNYCDGLLDNAKTIVNGFAGEEVVP